MSESIQTRRYAVSGGVQVEADVGGDPRRPAVILLHGGGQTRHSWHGAMREMLRRGYHVIAYDARGHGGSDWCARADYSLEAMSADLLAVTATLPALPALVGASMGGATLLFAAGNSERPVAGALVLVDIVPRVDPEGAARVRAFMRGHPEGFASVEEAADAVAAYNPHRPRPRDPSGLMKNLRRGQDGRLHWHWDPKFLDNPRRLEPPQFMDVLLLAADKVVTPTLLVRGLHSEIVTDEGVNELRRHLRGLEVCDVAGAGHMVTGDRNDAFNAGVLAFLGRHHPP